MKKAIHTIVAAGLISGMLATSALACDRPESPMTLLNPLWLPAAIAQSVVENVEAITHPPVIYERREYREPGPTIIYEEPGYYRHDHYYHHGPGDHRHDDGDRPYYRGWR